MCETTVYDYGRFYGDLLALELAADGFRVNSWSLVFHGTLSRWQWPWILSGQAPFPLFSSFNCVSYYILIVIIDYLKEYKTYFYVGQRTWEVFKVIIIWTRTSRNVNLTKSSFSDLYSIQRQYNINVLIIQDYHFNE